MMRHHYMEGRDYAMVLAVIFALFIISAGFMIAEPEGVRDYPRMFLAMSILHLLVGGGVGGFAAALYYTSWDRYNIGVPHMANLAVAMLAVGGIVMAGGAVIGAAEGLDLGAEYGAALGEWADWWGGLLD